MWLEYTLPAEYKVINSWLQRNHHGIPWSFGKSPYAAAGPIIRGILQRAHTNYVKGLEKKIWLSNLIGGTKEIVDLDSLGCPSLKNLRKSTHKDGGCSHHRSLLLTPKWNCASDNIKLLKKRCEDSLWTENNKHKKIFSTLIFYNLYEIQREKNLKRNFVEKKNNLIPPWFPKVPFSSTIQHLALNFV